jgi:hypothetical protein
MKLHSSLVDKLIELYQVYGGHNNENRLRSVLTSLDCTDYVRSNGDKVLVATDDLERERAKTLSGQ